MSNQQPQLPSRRQMLGLLGGLGAAVVVAGCGDDATTSSTSPTTTGAATASTTTTAVTTAAPSTTTAAAVTSCSKIPEETAGPFPGDGTNGPNVLTQSGVVRSDIRSSFGTGKGVAAGVPLAITLTVVDSKNGCKALAGAAVYVWHCDQAGNYSLYSQAAANENYLRGVQAAGDDGIVTFDSIFPACYQGRWPHIHFEVYPSLETANDEANKIATSQIALPKDACDTVYASPGYEQSVRNLADVTLDSDNVFSDGYGLQVATVTGSVAAGYTAALAVPL